MINRQVSSIFSAISELLELKGENPFRVRAYRNAARAIEGMTKDLAQMSEAEIGSIRGIGEDLRDKIKEIINTGGLQFLSELKTGMPEGIIELLNIPGIGPKTAKLLYDKLGVKDTVQLEALAKSHKLIGLPGIKEKTEENIIRGIELINKYKQIHPLGIALPIAESVMAHIKKSSPVQSMSIAGSMRRFKDTVRDIDILCTSKNPAKVMDSFIKYPHASAVLMHGLTKSSIIAEEGIQVDIRVVEEGSYGAALAYFTGSKAHNIRLREIALKSGLKLNEYGIYKGSKKLGGAKEEDVYGILNMPYIPPELREDKGEIKAAVSGRLPRLIGLKDIKGDLHVHTNRSDGKHTISELVDSARERGYEYIAITDHSKGLAIAGGLNEDELKEQIDEIDSMNKRLRGFKVLKGTEVDIRSDQTLDFSNSILSRLDIVVASIHSGFKQPSSKLTARMESAMKNPHVSLIAHPTGRLLGEREAYDIDMMRIIKTAAETGTALELNSYPLRLDLNDAHCKSAKENGVSIAINTDAHLTGHFAFMSFGVSTARRGWIEKGDVLNTLSVKPLLVRLKKN